MSAKVLSVEKSVVRGRIVGPVERAEQLGLLAGHGFRIGDLVDDARAPDGVGRCPAERAEDDRLRQPG